MITPEEAYNIIKQRYPDNALKTVTEFETCYSVPYAIVENDMVDTDYKVDKETGEVSMLWFDEYIELMKPYHDELPKTYTFE